VDVGQLLQPAVPVLVADRVAVTILTQPQAAATVELVKAAIARAQPHAAVGERFQCGPHPRRCLELAVRLLLEFETAAVRQAQRPAIHRTRAAVGLTHHCGGAQQSGLTVRGPAATEHTVLGVQRVIAAIQP
jgi:hypothetical protein